MPEVFDRSTLMGDPDYQVWKDGRVTGCKLRCPGCGCNTFVVLGGINVVDSIEKVRFAFGDGKAIMPVSSQYFCFSPTCMDVKEKPKRTEEELETLRGHVADGVTGANAADRGLVAQLRKLGVVFSGHEGRVIMQLPRKARPHQRTTPLLPSARQLRYPARPWRRCASGTMGWSSGSRAVATTSLRCASSCPR